MSAVQGVQRRAQDDEVHRHVVQRLVQGQRAAHLGREHLGQPLRRLELDEPARHHAGRVHHAVQGAEAADGGGNERAHALRVRHVGRMDDDLGPQRLDLAHGGHAAARLRVRAVVRQQRVPPLAGGQALAAHEHQLRLCPLRQQAGDGQADAAQSARQQVHAALAQAHGRPRGGFGCRHGAEEALPAAGSAIGHVRRVVAGVRRQALGLAHDGVFPAARLHVHGAGAHAGVLLRDHLEQGAQRGLPGPQRLRAQDGMRAAGGAQQGAPLAQQPGAGRGLHPVQQRHDARLQRRVHRGARHLRGRVVQRRQVQGERGAVPAARLEGGREPGVVVARGGVEGKAGARVVVAVAGLHAHDVRAGRAQAVRQRRRVAPAEDDGAPAAEDVAGHLHRRRLAPEGGVEPVAQGPALVRGGTRVRRGVGAGRGGAALQPEALAVQRMARQHDAPAAVHLPLLRPVHGHAVRPQGAQGAQEDRAVTAGLLPVAHGGGDPRRALLPRPRPQHGAGPDLHHHRLAARAAAQAPQGVHALREAHGAQQVLHPVVDRLRLLRLEPRPRRVRGQGDRRGGAADGGHDARELLAHGLQQPGVEGMAHGQRQHEPALRLCALREAGDGLRRAGHDARARRVHGREPERLACGAHGVHEGARLRFRHRHGRHAARDAVQQRRAAHDERQRVFHREDAGNARRDVLAQRVARHGARLHAAALPQLRERVAHGEHGGMAPLGALQRIAVRLSAVAAHEGAEIHPVPFAGGGRVRRIQHRREIHPPRLLEDGEAAVHGLAEGGLRLVELARHPRVLRPQAGEEEDDARIGLRRGVRRHPRGVGAAQQVRRLGRGRRDERAAVRERLAAARQREREVREGELGMRFEMRGRLLGEPVQRGGRLRGEHEQLGIAVVLRGGVIRRLLQHDVRVGAAHAKGGDARAARPFRRPRQQPVGDEEGRVFEVDARVGTGVVQRRRDLSVPERQHRLDEARHARGRVRVADVRLHGADGAEAPLRGVERARQGRDFDRVAHGRARAVRLDVGDGFRRDARDGVRQGDHLDLPVHAGRAEAHLLRAVVVDGRAQHDGVDLVAVRQRVGEPLQDHDAHAAADDRAVAALVERAAAAVGREHALAGHVARLEGDGDADAAGQRRVALVVQQALAGQVQGHEARGARRLNGKGGAAQVQLVGRQRGQEVLVAADAVHQRVAGAAPAAPRELGEQVGVHVGPGKDADGTGERLRVAPRVLQRRPRLLQEQAVLRVHELRLARVQVEEVRVEQVRALHRPERRHEVRVRQQGGIHARLAQLLFRERRDGRHSVAQVAPEGIHVLRAGKAARHPHDGDALRPLVPLVAHQIRSLAVAAALRWRSARARAFSSRLEPAVAGADARGRRA